MPQWGVKWVGPAYETATLRATSLYGERMFNSTPTVPTVTCPGDNIPDVQVDP